MIKNILKDKGFRVCYTQNELGLFLVKDYLGNIYLDGNCRERLNKYTGYLKNNRVYVNNYCIITGKSKGVIKDFSVSSLELKRLVMAGKVIGLDKKSW